MFASAFIVPYFVDGSDLVIVPKELLSQPELQGDIYGFPTSDFHSITHRNWCPNAWDVGGSAFAGVAIGGFTASPGPVTLANPVIFTGTEETLIAEWENDGPEQNGIRPDFSLPVNSRIMPNWFGSGGDGFYPGDRLAYASVYPVFWDENGLNQTGWYMEVKFRLFASLTPYRWVWNGDYFLEQEIRVDVSFRGIPTPGSDPPAGWTQAEFTGFGVTGGGGSTINTSITRQATGEVRIQDTTGLDPNVDWGSQTMWALSGTPFPINLGLTIKNNYLDRPDY